MTYKQRALVDLDIVVYRAGCAADAQAKKELLKLPEGEVLYGEAMHKALAPFDYGHWAIANTTSTLEMIRDRFPSDGAKLYLTGKGNFREKRATIKPYKGSRDEWNKPKYYRAIREFLLNVWGAELIEGREADDAIGCEQFAHKDKSTCIVSIDKDLMMIPGWHYNWVKGVHEYVQYKDANLHLFRQMLEGDTTDNIPGIVGVGPKTVDKMLVACSKDLDAFRDVVIGQYKKQYGESWMDAYMEIGDLLWIQREEGKSCPFLLP